MGRATAYRHWPRPEQLMLDTMAGVELPFFRDPVTPVRPWLRGQLRAFADEIVLPAVAGVALAMMNSSGSSLPAEVHERFSATADTGLRAAVALAVADGSAPRRGPRGHPRAAERAAHPPRLPTGQHRLRSADRPGHRQHRHLAPAQQGRVRHTVSLMPQR